MARIGEGFSDSRNYDLIHQSRENAQQWEAYAKRLEFILKQYQEEYDYLVGHVYNLKRDYLLTVLDMYDRYGALLPPLPQGFIASLSARVTAFSFFEGGSQLPSKDSRQYNTVFLKNTTAFIYCEYTLRHFSKNVRTEYQGLFRWYYQDNGEYVSFREQTFSSYIDTGWETSWYADGCGFPNAGNWAAGTYLVRVFLNEELAAEDTFTIL